MVCEYADIRALIGIGFTTSPLKVILNTCCILTIFINAM